jgi:hypothetical protein
MGREDFLEKVVFDMTYILCNEKGNYLPYGK